MPNGPANDHFTGGGISASSAPAAVPSNANAPASANARNLPVPFIARSPDVPSPFGHRGAARDCRSGRPALDRLADRGGQRLRPLDQAEQRQDHEEMDEIPSGENARGEHVIALGGLRAEPPEPDARRGKHPEEWAVQRPIASRSHF